ncbi:MAG: hypothetical protein MSG77_03015, partial [Prevotella sp.]|nr:hypothetical protein [Prevotella sp.]
AETKVTKRAEIQIRILALNFYCGKGLPDSNNSNQMQLLQDNSFDTRMFKVTLSYHFNTSRSKYKGTEVGNSEKKRL